MRQKIYKLTFGEELANSISHGVMMMIVLMSLPFASVYVYTKGDILDVVGVAIFAISIFLMFMSSTLYHAMAYETKHKDVFRILDHIFIYVAIAGSYTPIALSAIGGIEGIAIIVIQWIAVLFGILYKSLSKKSMPKVSLTIYLVMGWTVVLFLPAFLRSANGYLLSLIVAGGISYSIGAFFYALKGFRYHHLVWHLFINIGALTHFIGIVFFLK